MNRPDRTIRVSSSSVATTTLVLLVAMGAATMGAAVPASATTDPGPRARLGEAKSVRAVAAVVAAVARDLVGGDCAPAATQPVGTAVSDPDAGARRRPGGNRMVRPAARPLDAHLIDLPPPA